MNVTVLYFSLLRDLSGVDQETVEIPAGSSLSEVLETIYAKHPGIADWNDKLLLAVNAEFSDRTRAIAEGDEIALMPPVQGG